MWFFLALAGAFTKSIGTVARKPLTEFGSPLALNFLVQILMAIGLFIATSTVSQTTEVINVLRLAWWPVLLMGIQGSVALYLIIKIISYERVSRVVPLFAFIPVFSLLFAFLLVREIPSLSGLIGVLLVVIGGYYVYLEQSHEQLIDPFLEIWRSKAGAYIVLLVILWGLGPAIDKFATKEVAVLPWALTVSLSIVAFTSIFVLATHIFRPRNLTWPKFNSKSVMLLVLVASGIGFGYVFQLYALQGAFVGYAQAIRRSDILFSLMLGSTFLGDKTKLHKWSAVVLMVVGAVIVGLSS